MTGSVLPADLGSALKRAQAHVLPFGNKGQVIKYVTLLSEAIYDNSLIRV